MTTETLSRTKGRVIRFKYPMRQTVPSNECNKMVVRSHRASTSRRQKIRKQFSDPMLSGTNYPDKRSSVPFVTKVQIRKTIDYDALNKIESANITQQSKEDKTGYQKDDQNVGFKKGGEIYNKREEKKKRNRERAMISGSETMKFKRVPQARSACSTGLTPVEKPEPSEDENLQQLIKKLTLKMKERNLVSKLGVKSRTVPLSTFARPTKGELALNRKGPRSFCVGGTKEQTKLKSGNILRPLWTPVFGASSNYDRLSPDMTLRGSRARTVPGLVAPRTTSRASRSTPDRIATRTFDRSQYLCRACKSTVCVRIPNGGGSFYDQQISTQGTLPIGELCKHYDASDDSENEESFSDSNLKGKVLGQYYNEFVSGNH